MNLLFTSAGRRSYLIKYFKKQLGTQGEIHVANSTTYATAMKYGDRSVISPLIYDEEYIPFLKKYCLEHSINALIPLFDIDLPIISKNANEFEGIGVKIIVSNKEIIDICNDKWKSFNFLSRNGYHTPLTFISISKAIEAINSGIIHFPLILKPRWGMGSICIYEADNMEELVVFYKKIKNNIHSTYLSYESNQSDENVIIQSKLEGQEHGMDIINDLQGNYQTTIVKKKHAMRSGETDCAETVMNYELEKMGEKLSEDLGHIGNLDLDVFLVDGIPYVLEMNARFGGGYPFSHIAGVNLPKAIIKWLKGEVVENSLLTAKIGVVGYKELIIIDEEVKSAP